MIIHSVLSVYLLEANVAKQSSCKNQCFLHGCFVIHVYFSFYFSKICALAKKYKSLTFLDECHATGFFGATGRYVDIQGTIIRTKSYIS